MPMDQHATHAMIRFGLGRRGAEPVPDDPQAWLAAQLDAADADQDAPVATIAQALTTLHEDRTQPVPAGQPARTELLWRGDVASAMRVMVTTAQPFRERLVWFWANHFTVSARKPELRSTILPFIHEAIRPHVIGRFGDMLLAVMRHPAMLWYLDNQESVGPDSPLGQRSHRGLNENLARECLELHTVSPAAGYTQDDVTAFARVLTGWSFDFNAAAPAFMFFPDRHDAGSKSLLGMTFPPGEQGGVEALGWLGSHPATFRHLAAKLLRHFVADTPAPEDVARIADVLGRTQGSLHAATLELTRLASAWQAPLAKLRSPAEFVVAAVRALDLPDGNRPDLHGSMQLLGQPLLAAPLPNGWPDTAKTWLDGEMLLRRSEWALGLAGRRADLEPAAVAEASLGALLTAGTLRAVRHAPSRREGLALLLASPEFQRR